MRECAGPLLSPSMIPVLWVSPCSFPFHLLLLPLDPRPKNASRSSTDFVGINTCFSKLVSFSASSTLHDCAAFTPTQKEIQVWTPRVTFWLGSA